MAIDKVVSGGQTGADFAGWRAAKRCGIVTGGFMPKGFLTEVGPRPEFAELYGAVEHVSPQYPPRTFVNAGISHFTLWFGRGDSRGYACTERACSRQGRPIWSIVDPEHRTPQEIAGRIRMQDFTIMNVAGNRESMSPGIGAWVEEYLVEMFGLLLK